MQKDSGVKTLGPFDHRRVEMGMRNRDGADAAACVYLGDCFVIQQRDAIPEQISSRRLEKQSTLANREFRFSADPQKLRRFIFDAVVMISAQLLERCPFLASVTDELPFIFANWTARRRFRSIIKLAPALHTDKVLHQKKVIDLADVTILKEHRDEGSPIKACFADCRYALPLPLQRAARPERGRA